jgi:hypothetical protein
MKGLINVFVKDYKGEGFTRENFMMGAMFVAGIVAMCIIAEIIDKL